MNAPSHQLDHVALGLPRIADALPFVVGELGGERFDCGPGMGFQWVQWRFPGGGVIELLEPAGEPGGFLHRFLESRGPGIHHVTFKVPDLEVAAERAREAGYTIVGWFDADPHWKECFLHPKQAQGIVVQLAPAEPAGEPVRLLGLRLAARDADAVRRQWQIALGGAPYDAPDGRLGFCWERSGLRIEVAIRPEAEQGPLQIELATGRPWPDDGHDALGTRFVRGDA